MNKSLRSLLKMNKRIMLRRPFFILLLFMFLLTSTGCQTLRKKFTRAKKADKEELTVMPVLEPIDYAPKKQLPQEQYCYRYSLWKNWYKDLVAAIDSNDNDKRIKYIMTELITQLEEMAKWITGDKKDQLEIRINYWYAIQREFDIPSSMRNRQSIKNKLATEEKIIRNHFGLKASLEYVN